MWDRQDGIMDRLVFLLASCFVAVLLVAASIAWNRTRRRRQRRAMSQGEMRKKRLATLNAKYNIGGANKPPKCGATHPAAAVVPASPATVTVVDNNDGKFSKRPTTGTVTRRARMNSKAEEKNSKETADNINVRDRRAALFASRATAVEDDKGRDKDACKVAVPDATNPVEPAARMNTEAEENSSEGVADSTNIFERRAALFASRASAVEDDKDSGKDACDVVVPDATTPVAPATSVPVPMVEADEKFSSTSHVRDVKESNTVLPSRAVSSEDAVPAPHSSPAVPAPQTFLAPDLPGWMETSDLLALLGSGPDAVHEAVAKVVREQGVGSEEDAAGPGTEAGVCRRWWDAAWQAGEAEVAVAAADAFCLHLGSMRDDLFSTADEQRAALLLAFLGTSPHAAMVRRVFLQNPSAARATLRLALAPLRVNKATHAAAVSRGVLVAAPFSTAAEQPAASEAIRRLEAWNPLEGLETLDVLLRSTAGSAALVVTLGIEARDTSCGHGAQFEADSCLGPLLGALGCVLPIRAHLEAAREQAESMLTGAGEESAPQKQVPVANTLAKLWAKVLAEGSSKPQKALANQFKTYRNQIVRNRQGFVLLVEAALVKAMTTKSVAHQAKLDVCAWLSKAIFLHESLPQLCHQQQPELLGEPGSGATCASSAFLMSLCALLLRLGARKFSSTDVKNLECIDISYLEEGSVLWESGAGTTVLTDNDEPSENDEDVSSGDGEPGHVERPASPPPKDGVQEEKSPVSSEDGDDADRSAATAAAEDSAENDAVLATPTTGETNGHSPQRRLLARRRRGILGIRGGGTKKEEEPAFSFATELFFLTHRALQVIVNPLKTRRDKMREIIDRSALAETGVSASAEISGGDSAAAVAAAAGGGAISPAAIALLRRVVFKETDMAVALGWVVEGFGCEAVTGLACQFGTFTAAWLKRQMSARLNDANRFATGGAGAAVTVGVDGVVVGDRGPVTAGSMSSVSPGRISGEGDAVKAAAAQTFARVPPALIETMCDAWVAAILEGQGEEFLTRRAAENAAYFCGEVMEQVDLRLWPPTQSKLVDVLEALIRSGTKALNNKGSRGYQGSMFWGTKRGFAGAILDDDTLRWTLPRQLMRLYVSIQSVEGLAAELHLSFFKYGVRQRVGRILLQLWAHPLGDSRKAILELVRASMSATTADGGAIGGSSTGAAAVLPQNLLARDFFTAAFDVITMFFNSGMEHLRDGAIEESANDGRPLQPGHPHWQKYSNERKSCKSSLDSMTRSILVLLTTLGQEREVLDLLRVGTLGIRSAALLSVMLRSLYGEEASETTVAEPEEWGLNKAELGGMGCQLLAGLAGPGLAKTKAFAAALKSVDSDFDSSLLEAAARGPGGGCLRGDLLTRLSLALEIEDESRKMRQLEAVIGGGKGAANDIVDPFEGVPHEIDNQELEREYGSAMVDLVHIVVESLSPGHYFDRRREGCTLINARKVATELMRKLPKMLPRPPHPDSAVFAVVDEEALSFCRFVISGPRDTPYECGLFVFDVFLPQNYPADPPMVNMVTTGQGTVRFNANLYTDGKVCLSLLGKDTGASVVGTDKWNPDTSSLWQVFASIQTLVLVKDPYYNEGGGRSNMKGQETAQTKRASADENARIMLETIRHAAVANLRNPPSGCDELVRTHFKVLRERILRRCREACENAPNERLRKATLKASMDLRAEMDRLDGEGTS